MVFSLIDCFFSGVAIIASRCDYISKGRRSIWVISGQTIADRNRPLSAVTPIADKILQCRECAISDHSLNNLKFPIHHIGIDQSARRVRESSWQSTDDNKVAVLPQAYRPLVARNDKVELHSCEAALARPLQGIRAHRPRHAASAGVGRYDVTAICDMATASAVVGAQIIGCLL